MTEEYCSEKSNVLAEFIQRNGVPHDHCLTCLNRHCRVQDDTANSCPMMHCKEGCGAHFHSCKLVEHILLCPNEKVPCINYENGCPIIMPRYKLGSHLETCPASVIYCTMEWNRWPLYSKEKQAPVTAAKYSIHAKYGQLDVALALRDQRILNESMKVSKKTRRVLRNNLTRRFPAVPLKPRNSTYESSEQQTNETSQTISDDDCEAPWEVAKNPPGLQSSVFSELYKATRQTTESLSAALDVVSTSYSNESPQVSSPAHDTEKDTSTSSSEDEEEVETVPHDGLCRFQYPDITLVKCALCKTHHHVPFSEAGESLHRAEASETTDEVTTMDSAEKNTKIQKAIEGKIHVERSKNLGQEDGFVLVPVQNSKEKPMQSPLSPSPVPVTLNNILNLDLTLEQITRYQQKPKSMYTFLCAQEFRRDEYLWHFKNVHGDIHANLNGWIEQRCPLAHYGCPYSVRRFHPQHEGMTVIHNSTVESFGLKPEIPIETYQKFNENVDGFENMEVDMGKQEEDNGLQQGVRESTPEVMTSWDYNSAVTISNQSTSQEACSTNTGPPRDMLTSLPFEILLDIGRCLDSFSLCNLALTCCTLREVCCNLVEERGIVIQQWEKKRVDGKATWRVAYKKWCFSTAFSPVTHWGFKSNPHMANHISKCPYYVKCVKTQPILLPSMPANSILEDRLKESINNPNLHVAGGEIVELQQAEEQENTIKHKPYSDF
ncbi:F-box only protein 30 isoform X2 [Lingula anatina]|uniref:F-box only protein 30 isoform X2 n=1 Tax=Lingula anatina TaxID=7574 RepID=A0A1S3J566_LINAN|nr:F-box only protein 30 isoform X2 [Lingula anatina]|eukprot:XP_013404984.1 F-box only protein 30 isoform X2 [Lingula anatina]